MLKAFHTPKIIEAGCDEAGRGCLAGPVVAAAVIFPANVRHPKLNDSKQLSAEDREALKKYIVKKALAWAIAEVDNVEIDRINILNASFEAMNKAVLQLELTPAHLLIDGNRFKNRTPYKHTCIIGGDGLYMSIAAASILAKTHRDKLMCDLHNDYPHYKWISNKGYGTLAHRESIIAHGLSPYHRLSFRQIPDEQLELEISS